MAGNRCLENKTILSLEEVASIFGISPAGLAAAAARGAIPVIRRGDRMRMPLDALERILADEGYNLFSELRGPNENLTRVLEDHER
jgi:hypothetical protein